MLVGNNVERGEYQTKEAKNLAEELGLDLVMVDGNRDVPVCKLMDYNKFIFKQNKIIKPQKSLKLKVIRFRPNTDENDLNIKYNSIIKFLKKGHKVKVYVFFKGREHVFKDKGKELLLKISMDISEANIGITESLPKMEGRNKMIMFLKPVK